MKRTALSCFLAGLLLATTTQAQHKDVKQVASRSTGKAEAAWMPVDQATAEKAWMEYMAPGEAHKMLAKSDGEWVGELTMWMAPGEAPMKSITTNSSQMILGGRYQVSTHKGDFMGMPFEGISTTGYDNAKKTYFSNWIDNMGTGIMNMEGVWDAATNSLRLKGTMICPANGKECSVRENYKIIDENTHLLEMYGPDMKTGKEFKNMEIRYTRKK